MEQVERTVKQDKAIDDAIVRKAGKSNQTPEEWIEHLVLRECCREARALSYGNKK